MHVSAPESDSVNMADGAGHYDLPRLTLTMKPGQTNSELEEEEEEDEEEQVPSESEEPDVMTMSTGEALLGQRAQEPSPFSRKSRIHKGDNHRDEGDCNQIHRFFLRIHITLRYISSDILDLKHSKFVPILVI